MNEWNVIKKQWLLRNPTKRRTRRGLLSTRPFMERRKTTELYDRFSAKWIWASASWVSKRKNPSRVKRCNEEKGLSTKNVKQKRDWRLFCAPSSCFHLFGPTWSVRGFWIHWFSYNSSSCLWRATRKSTDDVSLMGFNGARKASFFGEIVSVVPLEIARSARWWEKKWKKRRSRGKKLKFDLINFSSFFSVALRMFT